jgi:hypothetical protein
MAFDEPGVVPMIAYENGNAALDWLARAFGFQERSRMKGKDGRLAHGEMVAGDGVIMLATPTPDTRDRRAIGRTASRLAAGPRCRTSSTAFSCTCPTSTPITPGRNAKARGFCPSRSPARHRAGIERRILKGTDGCSWNGAESGRLPTRRGFCCGPPVRASRLRAPVERGRTRRASPERVIGQ